MKVFLKFRWPIIIFLIGLGCKLSGAWAKILHKPYADFTLTVGTFIQISAIVLAIVILAFLKKNAE